MGPIPSQPCHVRGLEATPDRVAHDACLDAIMEGNNGHKADDKETGRDQPNAGTEEALGQEHGAESHQDKAHTAPGIPTAQQVQLLEAPLQTRYLTLESVDFALLHTFCLQCCTILP